MTDEMSYEPATSQRQADFFEHAAHNDAYAAERKISVEVARGRHAATVAAKLFGKTPISPCAKCREGTAQ
jgi:phosphate-selective porin